LRAELPIILATRSDVLSPRMLRIIEELAAIGVDWTSALKGCRKKSKPWLIRR